MRLLLFLMCLGCAPLDNDDPDGDGFSAAEGDCDPLDASVYPGVGECPGDHTIPPLSCETPFAEGIIVSGPADGFLATRAVELTATDIEVSLRSFQADGVDVPGAWTHVVGKRGAWEFSPETPILPDTTYTWGLWGEATRSFAWGDEVDEGCVMNTFTTSALGLPVTDPDLLVGETFEVEVTWGTGLSLLLIYPSQPPFLLRIDSLDDSNALVTLAPTTPPAPEAEWRQEVCETTTAVTGTWDGTRIRLGGDSLTLPVGLIMFGFSGFGVDPPTTLELTDWSLQLTMHPDGATALLDSFNFSADTRGLGDFSTYSIDGNTLGDGTPYNFCEIVADWTEVLCEPCDDGLETCLTSEFTGWIVGQAPEPLVDIADIADVDAECDPAR